MYSVGNIKLFSYILEIEPVLRLIGNDTFLFSVEMNLLHSTHDGKVVLLILRRSISFIAC